MSRSNGMSNYREIWGLFSIVINTKRIFGNTVINTEMGEFAYMLLRREDALFPLVSMLREIAELIRNIA